MEKIQVVIYLKQDYSENESIWIDKNLSKKEITKIINKKFDVWYYYDILE